MRTRSLTSSHMFEVKAAELGRAPTFLRGPASYYHDNRTHLLLDLRPARRILEDKSLAIINKGRVCEHS